MALVEHHQSDVLERIRLQRLQHETSFGRSDDDLWQLDHCREINLLIKIANDTVVTKCSLKCGGYLIDERQGRRKDHGLPTIEKRRGDFELSERGFPPAGRKADCGRHALCEIPLVERSAVIWPKIRTLASGSPNNPPPLILVEPMGCWHSAEASSTEIT